MILVLTGPVHAGKTTFLKNLLPSLRSRRIPVSGYLSPSFLVKGRTSGYDLLEIKTGRSFPFLRREGRAVWERVGPFFFLPSGLRNAESLILGCAAGDWLVVDEVGPRELAGGGVWPALSSFLSRPDSNGLLVVRRPLLREFREFLEGRIAEVFDIASDDILDSLPDRLAGTGSVRERTKPRSREGSRP